ncbi:site-2 protease family protein [Acaryochloris marina]|uniref:site-2 protease family protein n=1 Tax=Acaryochloris marina TaxID=155978 RepID=UPI001BB0125D|nr:site-2 protease family protein [Acaryochloris marina]QUY41523.1 site-2 protease family protein [Acaryochloris marina S15]
MTGLLFLAAFVILGVGYQRARPMGQIGVLAWLQSLVLMGPWLLMFGLLSLGITLNLASVLLMVILSISLYITLGRRLRYLANQDSQQVPPPTSPDISPIEATSAPSSDNPVTDSKASSSTPPEIPPTTIAPPPISAEDLKSIQGIFGIDTFFATETIPYQDGVIIQGNLRGDVPTVHSELTQQLESRLPEQYRLFLVENTDEKPIVIVLPRRNDPKVGGWTQKLFATILSLATIGSCLITGAFLLSFNLIEQPERLSEALPIGLGLVGVLVAHEVGHQVSAQRYQVRLSWPFPFPALQIGSFGVFNRFESLLPNRQSLFDIAFSGPAAGGLFSLTLLILGLILSPSSPILPLDISFLRGSIFVGTLARLFLGDTLQVSSILVHPLVGVGWLGLVITALNLMPAGSLDGGRIIQAIYGRKIARLSTWITLVILALIAIANPIALYWAIIILLLQRDLERPSLNELTEPDDTRAALGLAALFIMVAILLPLSPSLATRIGIGV